MKHVILIMLGMVLSLAFGCRPGPPPAAVTKAGSLTQARQGYTTRLATRASRQSVPPTPPERLFSMVYYPGPKGDYVAYVSVHPKDNRKRPGIVWIAGGDCNSIGSTAWEQASATNDQSARAFRQEGIVLMFPALRGGSGNPGYKEGFFGEVDDILAAADFLATQSNVDPSRIYLGGHSTGGTLALLAAECSSRFRAVFSFGPVADVSNYDAEHCPFRDEETEIDLRSPGRWLASIQCPTFVIEGEHTPGNVGELHKMSYMTKNQMVKFYPVPRADHFSVLSPATRLLAKKILADRGTECNIEFRKAEIDKLILH